MEDRVGLVATEDIAGVGGPVDMVDTAEVEDPVGREGTTVATEGIIADVEDIVGITVGMADIMVVMVGSFPAYLSAVS